MTHVSYCAFVSLLSFSVTCKNLFHHSRKPLESVKKPGRNSSVKLRRKWWVLLFSDGSSWSTTFRNLTPSQHLESRRRRPLRRASVAGYAGPSYALRGGSRYLAAVPETIEIVDVDVQVRPRRLFAIFFSGVTVCPSGVDTAIQACSV